MTDDEHDDVAARLTRAVVALDGVRGIFPDHPIGGLVLTLVTADQDRATAKVGVEASDAGTAVRARLAVDRDVPSAETIRRVRAEVIRAFPDAPVRLSIEVAHID